ncbi:hypothetical protein HELRODRAFT_172529 [Helobdella robusta]|uniref:Uncharacterized protein n=1 Tax=Helobdella robusta TaxID=6412 RepID=T1F5G8_HELRO|nr:hypothetical protein HELRODRAFT_172529 [Helobdella robusta]ESO04183.1 hypothetical protein HELRODRAFT_172529 [Helobdella robusta]
MCIRLVCCVEIDERNEKITVTEYFGCPVVIPFEAKPKKALTALWDCENLVINKDYELIRFGIKFKKPGTFKCKFALSYAFHLTDRKKTWSVDISILENPGGSSQCFSSQL